MDTDTTIKTETSLPVPLVTNPPFSMDANTQPIKTEPLSTPVANDPPTPMPPPVASPPFSAAVFRLRQTATDIPRVRWSFSHKKTHATYRPTVSNKWWSRTDDEIAALNSNGLGQLSHISRIMETELGEHRSNDESCTHCVAEGLECWVYTLEGQVQVAYAGEACARCRDRPKTGGCSLAVRSGKKKKVNKVRPFFVSQRPVGPRQIAPLQV